MISETAFALVASLTFTVKDVFRFSETLTLNDAFANPCDQLLKMVDCRTQDMKKEYYERIGDFMTFGILQEWET